MRFFIYETTCLVTNKKYIGLHQCKNGIGTDGYLGSGTYLKKAIKKYGKENFEIEQLIECTNRVAMGFMEKVYVGDDIVNDENYYNLQLGGTCFTCYKHTQEDKQKMSDAHTGRKMSAATKKKISDAHTGKKLSAAHKQKLSIARQNMSAETKKKMSDAHTGKKLSAAHKQKISESCKKTLDKKREKLSRAMLANSAKRKLTGE